MSNNLFARMPLPRNLLNIDSMYNRNYFNSEPPPEDAHDIAMRLLGREPTPDEVGARMMEALRTRAVPDASGDNFPDRGPFGFVHDALADVRDRYEAANRQYQGEGRREENVPELPLSPREQSRAHENPNPHQDRYQENFCLNGAKFFVVPASPILPFLFCVRINAAAEGKERPPPFSESSAVGVVLDALDLVGHRYSLRLK